jgi:AbrB family looped-hinge helix DNA binding protein
MAVVTVSQKGWVVIPSELRAKYGWQTGKRVQVVDYGGVVSLVPILDNPEEAGFGALKQGGRTLLKSLKKARLDERRRERLAK